MTAEERAELAAARSDLLMVLNRLEHIERADGGSPRGLVPSPPVDLYALLTKEGVARHLAYVDVKTLDAMDAADPMPWFVPEGTTRKRMTPAGWYVYMARKQNAALHP